MQGFLYQIDASDGLRRMSPSAPGNEDEMQNLVARFPELISESDGELLLIRREQAIADSTDGSGRWSIDHLFVTRSAVPVLVELKRAVDTRLRREVVGQMLDYAANASVYWQAGSIAKAFAKTSFEAGKESDKILAEFAIGVDPDDFWQQVESNLRAGRFKLIFVADRIPRELARIVEFMNDQMQADVRAVELRWYSGEDGSRTLSPRVIGVTERAAIAKTSQRSLESIGIDDWIATRLAPISSESVEMAGKFVEIIKGLGGEVGIPNTQGSIFSRFANGIGEIVYPFHVWPQKTPSVSFSLNYLKSHQVFASEAVRQKLYDDLVGAVGPLTSQNLSGFPGFPLSRLGNPEVADKYAAFVQGLLHTGAFHSPHSCGEES